MGIGPIVLSREVRLFKATNSILFRDGNEWMPEGSFINEFGKLGLHIYDRRERFTLKFIYKDLGLRWMLVDEMGLRPDKIHEIEELWITMQAAQGRSIERRHSEILTRLQQSAGALVH